MDSKFLLAEVQACCSSLGYLDDGEYHRGEDHLNAIKDLIRYLRRDGEICQIRRIVGEARVLQNDLVPMLKQYKDDETLFDLLVRLLVNLTQPAALCFNNKPPEDKELRVYYLQITSHLQSYKQFFANQTAFFSVITKKLVDLFNREWEEREEEERLLVERLLLLVRNVVGIPSDPEAEKRTDNDVSVHDLLYWSMQSAGLESVFLYISSTSTEAQFCLHTLEIINHVLREQSPAELASAGQTRTEKEQENDSQELEAIRLREAAMKRMNTLKYSGRHSHFGGTFTLANVKGIADNDAIVHKPLNKIKERISFDDDKKRRRRAKNKLPPADRDATRKSTQAIRVVLRDFCAKFLDHCYNPVMRAVRDAIRHKKGEENDETFYFWAMRFFMEFNRLYNFDVGLVSETLSMSVFHTIQVHLTDCYERMVTEKRQKHESLAWGRRLHLALKAYQEMLLTVHAMGKSKDPVLLNNGTILKNNLFYVMEYRDLFVMLLKKFDETRLSKSFLRDLFETAHVFVKMLEDHCKGSAHTMVQKTKVIKKKNKKEKPGPSAHSTLTASELEAKWESMATRLSGFLSGAEEIPDDVIPFDAASSVGIEDQKTQAMIRIQATLRDDQAGEALALLRAARSVWREGDVFGAENISPEEELDALRQVMMAELPSLDDPREGGRVVDEEEDEEEKENEEEEQAQQMVPVEVEFKFEEYLTKFARGEVIKNCCLVLKDYAINSSPVNHAVVKLLHRLCVDMKLAGLTHQVAMLRVFRQIIHDPAAKKTKHLVELYGFAKFMTRKFFEDLTQNPLLVVEALFWKDIREAIDVTEGYGSFKEKNKAAKTLWTEDQEAEIRLLWEEHKHRRESGEDVADVILDALSDPGEKTRTQLVRQMVRMGLLGSARDLKVTKRREPKTSKHVWPEELTEELKGLFEKHDVRSVEDGEEGGENESGATLKEADKPLDVIDKVMRDLSDGSHSRKEVLTKLASMNLIQDPNAYRKKGARHIAYWREEQTEELKTLWSQYEDAQSPLDRIGESIAEKRSKRSIADKLVELGLVADKKALMAKGRKERKGKGDGDEDGRKKNPWGNHSDEEVVVTPPTTDDENAKKEYEERKKMRKTKLQRDVAHSKSKNGRKKEKGSSREKLSASRPSTVQLASEVKDLRDRGLEDPVKWLRAMMRVRADDLKDGDEEDDAEADGGFAIVPLTEENEEAMGDAGFLRLMRGFGFSEPIVGQEAFWRIPAAFEHERLYATAAVIDAGLRAVGDEEEVTENVGNEGASAVVAGDSSSGSGSDGGSSSGSDSGSDSDSDRDDDDGRSNSKPPRIVRSTSSTSSRAASVNAGSQRTAKSGADSDDDDDLDKFLSANKSQASAGMKNDEDDGVDGDGDFKKEGNDRWKMLREMANTRRAENVRGEKSNRQKRRINKEKFSLKDSEDEEDENVASPNIGKERNGAVTPITDDGESSARSNATPSQTTQQIGAKASQKRKKKTVAPVVAELEEEEASPAIDASTAKNKAKKRRVLKALEEDDEEASPAIDEPSAKDDSKKSRAVAMEEEGEEASPAMEVADKSVELGLVADKKALMAKGRKARKGKGDEDDGKKNPWVNRSDEEEVVTPPTTDDENAKKEYEERKKTRKTKLQRDVAHSKSENERKKEKGASQPSTVQNKAKKRRVLKALEDEEEASPAIDEPSAKDDSKKSRAAAMEEAGEEASPAMDVLAKTKSRKRVLDDSDDDDDDGAKTASQKPPASRRKRSKVAIVEEDGDDEEEKENEESASINQRRRAVIDSDSD